MSRLGWWKRRCRECGRPVRVASAETLLICDWCWRLSTAYEVCEWFAPGELRQQRWAASARLAAGPGPHPARSSL